MESQHPSASPDHPLLRVAGSLSEDAATTAATTWRMWLPTQEHEPRRPSVLVTDGQVCLVLFVLQKDQPQLPLQLFANEHGVLAVGPADALAVVRQSPTDETDSWSLLVSVILAVARHCEGVLHEMDDLGQELAELTAGFASSPQRRSMGRLRAHLFQIQETQAAQQELLAPDEELAQVVGEDHQRLLKRAANAFAANRSLAARLYALLGDLLQEQDTAVAERLTLVATIFLPLTVATGFFGMNFGWLVDHLTGLPAFIVLGIAVPTVLTLGTLLLVRTLTRAGR